jgi:predicted  nucleic acid-binding Zn-ribbon protein
MSKHVLTFLLACCSVTSVFASPYLQYVPPPDFSAANQLYASGSQQMQQGIQQLGNGLVRVAEAAERRKQQQQQQQIAEQQQQQIAELQEQLRIEREQAKLRSTTQYRTAHVEVKLTKSEESELTKLQNLQYTVPVTNENGDTFYCMKGFENPSVDDCRLEVLN